jgi:beta-lactam-binding protein with PASTA domain
MVLVPSFIGMASNDATRRAGELGLDWTLHCAEDAAQPEGIIDQEPAAGEQLAIGSPFNLYSARFADCQESPGD